MAEAAPNNQVPIYDISGQEPVLGHIEHGEVQDAISSGRYSLPKGHQINVLDPEGQLGTLDAHEAPEAFKNGYQYATPGMVDDYKNSSLGEQAKAFGEGAAQGVAGPLAPIAEKALGVKDEDILRREKTIAHGVGQAAGLVGGALTGTGEAALMGKAGELAVEAAGLAKPVSYAAKVGSSAVQQAAEMAVLQGSDETAKVILQDPNTSAESALANIGLATALGGAGGAFVTGAVNPLWGATVGPHVDKFLGTLTDHLNGVGRALPEDLEAASRTLGVELPSELKGAQKSAGLAEKYNLLKEVQNPAIIQSEKDFHQGIADSIMQSIGKTPEEFQNYSEAEGGRAAMDTFKNEYKAKAEPIIKQFDELTGPFQSAPLSDAKIGELADQIVSKAQERGWMGKDLPQNEIVQAALNRLPEMKTANDIRKAVTEIGNLSQKNPQALVGPSRAITELMLDAQHSALGEAINEKAPQLMDKYLNARAAYADLAKTSNNLGSELGIGKFGGPESFLKALETKRSPEQFLRRLSPQGNAEILPFMAEKFPQTLEHIRENEMKNLVAPAVKSAKGNLPINVKTLQNAISAKMAGQPELVKFALPPELISKAQAAETMMKAIPAMKSSGTAGWIEKMTSSIPQSALAAVAYLGGHNPIGGAIIGHGVQAMRRNVPDAMRLGLLRFAAADQPIKAEGFKAMVDFLHNSIRGQTLLSRGVSNVFVRGAQVLTDSQMPNKKDTEKLDKIIEKTKSNPELMTRLADSHTGYYLPGHQTALSQATSTQVQYLQSLKPEPYRSGPMNREIEPSKAQEARYQRALQIACQPAVVLQHVKNGTVQTSDIKDLSTMYPAIYKQMAQKLSNQMINAHEGEDAVPYKTRMGLSLFLGQPIDTSMTPQSIMAAQPQPQATPQQPQGKPKKSTSTLGKETNKEYMTAGQSAEANRGKK